MKSILKHDVCVRDLSSEFIISEIKKSVLVNGQPVPVASRAWCARVGTIGLVWVHIAYSNPPHLTAISGVFSEMMCCGGIQRLSK